jgi:phosphoribosylformylglycinamidine synthase
VDALADGSRLCLRYVDYRGEAASRYPENPNGSPGGSAGFTTDDGRVTILMPHPERVYLRKQYSWLPASAAGAEGPWFEMFRNARLWLA